MKKGKNLIISSIIILIISAMLTFGFFLEEIIKNEASNIDQNRFLEKIALIIKDLNFDKIEENKGSNNYEVYKNDKLIALIYLNEEEGLSGKMLVELVFIYDEASMKFDIYDFTILNYNEKDKYYVELVLNDTDFRNEIKNIDINQDFEIDVVSGATHSSNKVINSIKESINQLKEGYYNEK